MVNTNVLKFPLDILCLLCRAYCPVIVFNHCAPQCLQPAPQLQTPATLLSSAMAPATRSLLRASLLLLLLLATSRQATGAPVANELRCQCLQTMTGVHLKNIQSLKVMPPGPHCTQTEVIATLKNGQEACLNPEAPMVQKIVQKMLKSGVHK